jgi:hypothetical protein
LAGAVLFCGFSERFGGAHNTPRVVSSDPNGPEADYERLEHVSGHLLYLIDDIVKFRGNFPFVLPYTQSVQLQCLGLSLQSSLIYGVLMICS